MNLEFICMVLLSVKRRRRSMWKVALISFCCIFLFAGIMIFQDCMNRFQRENAFLESGEWIVSTTEKSRCLEEHAWVDGCGTTVVRTKMCSQTKDKNMSKPKGEGPVGVADEEFVKQSNIVLYSGKMPKQADEIVVTQHVLSDMGRSFELGQALPLAYVKRYDDTGMPVYGFVEYKLAGILENYTFDWVVSEELPEYFVTMEGLASIRDVEKEDQQRCWYYLNQAQRDIDGEEFYHSMREICKKQGEQHLLYNMVYNSNAYDVTMWGNRNLYLVMMSLCGILGSMSLLYLFLMCCNNRRPYYFKLRELGASARQVQGMVCMEWSGVFVPTAIVGMIAAAVVSLVVAAIISRHFGIPFVFRLTRGSLWMILLFTVGVFLLVMLWSCLLFRIRNLHQMTGIISSGRLKHMCRKWDKAKSPVRLFQIRKRRAEPGKSIAQILFIIATMTIFLYSLWAIRSAYHTYQESESRSEIYVSSRGDEGTSSTDGITWDRETHQLGSNNIGENISVTKGHSIGNGMSTDIVTSLLQIPGVKQVKGAATDDQVGFVWDGMQDSVFLKDLYVKSWFEWKMKTIAEMMYDTEAGSKEWDEEWHGLYGQVFGGISDPAERPELFHESVVGLARTEKRDQLLKKIFGKNFDSEDFWNGKQSILFQLAFDGEDMVPNDIAYDSPYGKPLQGILKQDDQNRTIFYGKWGEDYQYRFEENTLKTGDSVQICHTLLPSNNVFSTEVICCDNNELYYELMGNQAVSNKIYFPYDIGGLTRESGGMQLVTSETLLQQLAHEIGEDFTYRTLLIDVDNGVNRKQVEANVADVLSRYGEDDISFYSCMGDKERERNRFYRQVVMFGVILILTGSVYLFISRSMQNRSMELVRKQLQQFLQCGCSRVELIRFYTWMRIRESIWSLTGIPLCALILVVMRWIAYWKEVRSGEAEFEKAEWGMQCINAIKDYFYHPFEWILFLGFLVLTVWFGIRGQVQYLKKLELMGHEE
ncbi:MAG: hypothetical protein K2J67_09875 [Lachnospiraceae bacterium]|nr:hypothetical protein [Lachnospiraceae bacterium]